MTLESAPSEMTAPITTTTTPPTTKDRRGPPTVQVARPKGPEPMSKKPFKVGFQNIHRGIANANVILEEGVRRDWDVIFLAEPWVERKVGRWATMVQAGFDIVSTLTQDTKLVAYVNIKHRQEVEKKEEDLNWCVVRAGGQTSAGVYMSKEWTVQKYG